MIEIVQTSINTPLLFFFRKRDFPVYANGAATIRRLLSKVTLAIR